ncbi:ABC transporter substrate-binding protein [Falsiroseomonas selenitidurans]|uniref:Oligopeptide ABC transporter substrate-binding protein n=1 Tax=Falsiroseomonas selenitidurans TaxID=2716335 RepID=A0ABX1DXL9_9PROT|nr:ABC transporter substrate-binding protein [Falsiroseomonas selenitidurans]NKC29657.1 oligopeptide ABC transporter substrate-binding protein [Falsiroseomonas selenitidurans]
MTTRRALLASALAAPALPRTVRAQADARPVLRIAVQALPPTLEPLESISNVGLRVSYNVFDTLWRRDFRAESAEGGQRLTPFLATALEQRDPLTWVATLRRDVRMHDDTMFGPADVLSTFSAERMWGPQVQTFEGRVNFGHLAGVEAEGADKVVFRTRTPDPVMPQRLAAYGGWIHSARAYAESGRDGLRRQPVGSGPYRVASFQRDQRAVLDSHDAYWQGRPPAKQVVFTVVPEASSRLAGLQAGDFDLVTNLLPEQIEGLAGNPTLEGVDVALDFAHILYYDTRQPALRDARVRRALNHAVDTELLGRALWGAAFKPMPALQIPAFGDLYDAQRRGFTFDPDRSRRLLAEAGYRGEELTIRIAPGYYLQMLQAVQIVQQMWTTVGVRTRLETRENLSLLTQPGADIRPTSIAFRFPDPLGGGLAVHLAEDYSLQKNGFWQPVRFNALVRELRLATAPAERRRVWLALLDEFEAEAPALILYPVREYFAKRRAINWMHYPLYYMDFRATNLSFS